MSANTKECLENNYLRYTALEGLVLDLQVMQADLRQLQGQCSGIENSLRELEQWVQAMELVSKVGSK